MSMFGLNSSGVLLALWGTLLPIEAAGASDSIPPAYEEMASLYEIPADIFYAMALQESGRRVEGFENRTPWPWTLNVAGAGYYYDSQAEAWDAIKLHVENGAANIGVGLMQVTWPYNQYALVDIYSALDPSTNLRLGAQILRACYDRLRDWWSAVGCYHSPGTSATKMARADAYVEDVKRRRRMLLEKPAK